LSSLDRLRREEWSAEPKGPGIDVFLPGRLIECHFRNRALTHVRVDADSRSEPVAVSYRGRRIDLPTTAEAIKSSLGPPK
jgi:hypothetical protein